MQRADYPGTWNSAFSPEDLPSDLVGVCLAKNYLEKSGGNTKNFNSAMSDAIKELFQEAGAR